MERLNFHNLNDFIKLISMGNLGPGYPVEVTNMSGNKIHRISFIDHCDEICKKHKTNRLRLLSVMTQKLNGDMVLRLSNSPVFRDKVKGVVREWGETVVEPIDLFQCSDTCYDCDNIEILQGKINECDNQLKYIDDSIEMQSSDLYDNVLALRNNYQNCDDSLRNILLELENRKNEYDPRYRSILCDLSTKQKAFYLNELMNEETQENLIQHVNKRVNRDIPDNINNIFMNIVIIPTMINKEMEKYKLRCMNLKDDIAKKQDKLNMIIMKIEPGLQPSVGFMDMLSGITKYFDMSDDENMPDDDYSSDDEQMMMEQKLKEIIQKKKGKPIEEMVIEEKKDLGIIEPERRETNETDETEEVDVDKTEISETNESEIGRLEDKPKKNIQYNLSLEDDTETETNLETNTETTTPKSDSAISFF